MRKMNYAEVYEDRKGEWRWRIIAKNGKIIADSGEGYNSKTVCKNRLKALDEVLSNICDPFATQEMKDLRIRIVSKAKPKAAKAPAMASSTRKKVTRKKAATKKPTRKAKAKTTRKAAVKPRSKTASKK